MGDYTVSRDTYDLAVGKLVPKSGDVTGEAEQEFQRTGRLDPLVDPAGFDLIRFSRPRFKLQEDEFYRLTVGTPLPVEITLDTTVSMKDNVNKAMKHLPEIYGLCYGILPEGYDLQVLFGIFQDIRDEVVLCRGQFEMESEKAVKQLTLMVPDRNGYDIPEDPHYALLAAACLSRLYINLIGLKGYHVVVTDAEGRPKLEYDQIVRIFGESVFDKIVENGHEVNCQDLPTTKEIVQDLLKIAHAFVIQVGYDHKATQFWDGIYGENRVVKIPGTEYLSQVIAAIIGLTEGTLNLQEVKRFLTDNGIRNEDAEKIFHSLVNIPLRAQADLPNFGRRPQKGDLFRNKTDIWPIDQKEVAELESSETNSDIGGDDSEEGPGWHF